MGLTFLKRNLVACPKCGAMVEARILEAARLRSHRLNKVLGYSLPFEENLDGAIIWKGYWGNYKKLDHDTACGCCGTTRRSKDWLEKT